MIFLFEDHPLLKERIKGSFADSLNADTFMREVRGTEVDGKEIIWYINEGDSMGFISPKRMSIIESYLKEFYPEALI